MKKCAGPTPWPDEGENKPLAVEEHRWRSREKKEKAPKKNVEKKAARCFNLNFNINFLFFRYPTALQSTGDAGAVEWKPLRAA